MADKEEEKIYRLKQALTNFSILLPHSSGYHLFMVNISDHGKLLHKPFYLEYGTL